MAPRTPETAGETWDLHARLSPDCTNPVMMLTGPPGTDAKNATGIGCIHCDFRTEFEPEKAAI